MPPRVAEGTARPAGSTGRKSIQHPQDRGADKDQKKEDERRVRMDVGLDREQIPPPSIIIAQREYMDRATVPKSWEVSGMLSTSPSSWPMKTVAKQPKM